MRLVFLKAWLLCGTLDALYATALAVSLGGNAAGLWRFVASGPFGDGAADWGAGGIAAGLLIHFAIMAAMIAGGFLIASKSQLGTIAPWKAGTLYGLVLYGIMYGLVMQARFGVPFPNPDKFKLALGLFPHIFFVGIPIFTLARQEMNTSPPR